ncbi:acetyl-CoA carboxylase biotin carboxyl carrier protein [Shewanella gelidimarina]|uniref:acetyl-CoA carboxylase biotin carboxyl carrier protein n=1 Tax=Shewanella gelidimarina TaxID=56813 RepID=UPI002010B45C|nr:acetyl-CoA carboxylase biotin carboxyl carrier protein [Shewanella gelidimarina]MCL1056703.1 acetyl-CoA carboxylase biotin carboxyl carrier protein [Shewanella gelidimarina]
MDIRKIKKLIELVQESDIAELEIKEGEESVRICRHSPLPIQAGVQTFLVPASSVAAPTAEPSSNTGASKHYEDLDSHKLLSPMVGTLYLTDKNTDKPLCFLGQQVKQGDIVCIIEAMTMMNRIAADKSGTITAILIEDGEQIDFEQPLLVIE